jgi:hypothetical protein
MRRQGTITKRRHLVQGQNQLHDNGSATHTLEMSLYLNELLLFLLSTDVGTVRSLSVRSICPQIARRARNNHRFQEGRVGRA